MNLEGDAKDKIYIGKEIYEGVVVTDITREDGVLVPIELAWLNKGHMLTGQCKQTLRETIESGKILTHDFEAYYKLIQSSRGGD